MTKTARETGNLVRMVLRTDIVGSNSIEGILDSGHSTAASGPSEGFAQGWAPHLEGVAAGPGAKVGFHAGGAGGIGKRAQSIDRSSVLIASDEDGLGREVLVGEQVGGVLVIEGGFVPGEESLHRRRVVANGGLSLAGNVDDGTIGFGAVGGDL